MPTCEELIDGRLQDAIDFYSLEPAEALESEGYEVPADHDGIQEAYFTMIHDSVLCIDRKVCGQLVEDFTEEEILAACEECDEWPEQIIRTVTVLTSWGGPSDGFDFYVDEDGELLYAEYWYQDWFDGARRRLDPDFMHHLSSIFCIERGVSHNFS
jgi:hypothetical protein